MNEIGNNASNAGVAPTGADPAAAEGEVYTFATPVRRCFIQSKPNTGPTMQVTFNKGAAGAATDCDVELASGDSVLAPEGLLVTTVGIYFSGAAALGTDFFIKGWV